MGIEQREEAVPQLGAGDAGADRSELGERLPQRGVARPPPLRRSQRT
jgi:hypothetical protein